jgi:hypothetical protein
VLFVAKQLSKYFADIDPDGLGAGLAQDSHQRCCMQIQYTPTRAAAPELDSLLRQVQFSRE